MNQSARTKKALFLDRDGIFTHLVNHPEGLGAPRNWKQVRFFDEMQNLSRIKSHGYLLILATNQPDIERGWIEQSFADELNDYLSKHYGLDGIYMCTFSDEDHPMKKPNPGMFFKAAEDFLISLSASFHLGDTWKDVSAAQKAGVKPVLWSREYNQDVSCPMKICNLKELEAIL
ncbi:MAG: HAD-IIIA family hydrolase [Deltaproteobacteria bacterium]|nr:HAD-IIIA family hydrolase [Deltaproteobacteria bacterium]